VLRRVKPKSVARSKKGADSLSSFVERSLEGSVAVLWMVKSPATRSGDLMSQREDSGETDWGYGECGRAYALPILKWGKFVLKPPCRVKTSNTMKSSVSGEKKVILQISAEGLWIYSRPLLA